MDKEIADAASAVGCPDSFVWEILPDHFASQLMAASKRYARFLKDSGLVKSHSEALEVVAKAAGQPHWHAFHSVVQGLFAAFNPEVHWSRPNGEREPIKTLIPAFVFMTKAPPDCPPSPEEQAGLSKAADKLARACGRRTEEVLDVIGKMNGADSWEKLLCRRPEQASGPLYEFQVDVHGTGRFAISYACSALIDQQDALFQGFGSRPMSEQREFEALLARVLEARPDFLEGLLAKAAVLQYKPHLRRQQGKVYTEAIKRADDLIPAGFKGEIPWGYVSNRFYHRLLYGAMVWHSHEGHTAKAVALARRQLRMNKGDNLGVRLWLPVLLVADGKLAAADKARLKMAFHEGRTDAGFELVNAICHFANGRHQQATEALYLSVFKHPPMRHIITANRDALDASLSDTKSSRSYIPDAQNLLNQYVSAAMKLGDLEQTFKRWLARPAVAVAEDLVARVFHSNWGPRRGTLSQWDAEVKKQATLLSKAAMLP